MAFLSLRILVRMSRPLLFFLITLFCLVGHVLGSAVLGIDFGSQYVKLAAVVPGTSDPLVTILNDLSERKTPNMIAFKNDQFFIGTEALKYQQSRPESAYSWLNLLAGRSFKPEEFEGLCKEYFATLHRDSLGNLQIEPSKGELSPIEYPIALLLKRFVKWADDDVKKVFREIVVTVPPYFCQSRRQALLNAAQIAGIKISSLITDVGAAAVYYGAFSLAADAPRQHVIFFDAGATHTSAALALFDPLFKEGDRVMPLAEIRQVVWDTELHGLSIDRVIAAELAKRFGKPITHPGALNRLLQEASKIKRVLSANSKMRVVIDDLINYESLSTDFTRGELEALCAPLKGRATELVNKLITASKIPIEEISGIILLGGSSYFPLIKNELENSFPSKIREVLNKEETISKGAAWYAAMLSHFRVKPMVFRDVYPFGVSLIYGENKSSIQIFPPASLLGTRKSVSLKEWESSGTFIQSEFEGDLLQIGISGFEEAMKKHHDKAIIKTRLKYWIELTTFGMISIKDSPVAIVEYKNSTVVPETGEVQEQNLTDTLPLELDVKTLYHHLDEETIAKWNAKILFLEDMEKRAHELSGARNHLESMIYRISDLLESGLFEEWVDRKEIDSVVGRIQGFKTLVLENMNNHVKEDYEEPSKVLTEFENQARKRSMEYQCRPEALKRLIDAIRKLEILGEAIGKQKITNGNPVFEKLYAKLEETQQWYAKMESDLKDLKKTENYPILCSMLIERSKELQKLHFEASAALKASTAVPEVDSSLATQTANISSTATPEAEKPPAETPERFEL